MTVGPEWHRMMRIIAWLLIVASACWATAPCEAQSVAPSAAAAQRPRHIAPVDPALERAYQKAREQYVRTWGFAPGQQTAPVAGSFPVTRWSSIGPGRITFKPGFNQFLASTGRLNAIAIHPRDPNIIYVGAADGGVWKTTDGGSSWVPMTDGQCTLAIGAIAIDPRDPSIVYAGTGDPAGLIILDRTVHGGCGVLRSTDDGLHWKLIADATAFPASGVAKLVIDPATAGSATSTTIFAATIDLGLLRSFDSGSSWRRILGAVGDAASDVVLDPSNSQTVYAAIGNAAGSSTNGIFKSTAGGNGFVKLGGGFPSASVGAIKLDVAPSNPAVVYAAVHRANAEDLLGIFRSPNSGTNWGQMSGFGLVAHQLPYNMTLNIDPASANVIYFGEVHLQKSTDDGQSFTDITNSAHFDFHAFAFQPGSPTTIYAGSDGGIFKSTNAGSSWTSLSSGLAITQFYPGGALHPTDPNIAIGGTQDNGTIKYSGFAPWDQMVCDDGHFTAIDQGNPSTYYAICFLTVSPLRSDDAGFSWTEKSVGIGFDTSQAPPLVMSPSNPQTLYFGTNKIYKTTDRAEHWIPSTTTFGNDTVKAIAQARGNSDVTYAIVRNRGVFRSIDGNGTYVSISSGLPSSLSPTALAVPFDAATAIVAMSGSASGFISQLFMTTNGGASWTDISGGNLPQIPINAIVLDPSAPTSKILIATDLGVFGTINAGPNSTWAPAGVGMPNVIVTDLVYNPVTGVVMAFTFGRGAWKASLSQTVTHDFDGDHFSDIAWRQNTGDTAAWQMTFGANGAQILSAGSLGVVPLSWQLVGQRDFDGDGRDDWLWRESNGTVAMWLLARQSTVNGPPETDTLQVLVNKGVANVTTNWVIAGTGDFSGDFKGDILWRESTNGSVAIWLMDSFHIVDSVSLGMVSTNWVIAGTGDFDGDGGRDILWRDSSSGTVAIWFLDRRPRLLQSASLGAVTSHWVIAGTGDFNGDGMSDILWRNTDTGTVAIWLMNGLQIRQIGILGDVSSDFVIAETGDFNGDGKSDVLWRHTPTGVVVIWFMNGLQVSSTAKFGGADTSWAIQGLNAD